MNTQKRMIKGIISEAAKTDVVMPWSRGARRTEWIAKRNAATTPLKAARS